MTVIPKEVEVEGEERDMSLKALLDYDKLHHVMTVVVVVEGTRERGREKGNIK